MYRALVTGLAPVLLAVSSAGPSVTTQSTTTQSTTTASTATQPLTAPTKKTTPAQAPSQGPRDLTEAEFLAVLDELHPAVIERSQELATARARVVAAGTLENPVLGAVRENPEDVVSQTDWLLTWQLPQPGRGARVDSAEQTARGAEARLSQDMVTLRLAMRQVYADWAVATERDERLAAQAERVSALAERSAARAGQGETSGLEAHRLGLAASDLRARSALAAVTAQKARAGVSSWHPDVTIDTRPVLPTPPTLLSSGETAEHPLVAAARADLAAAELSRKAAGRYLRSPEVTAGWQRQEVGPEVIDGPVLAFAWPLPFVNRNQGPKAEADARVLAAEARLESVRREIGAARDAAGAVYEQLTTALVSAEAALTDNNRMLDGAEVAFRLGELTLTDLLETIRSVTESELTTLELQAATLRANRELVRLYGTHTSP